MPKLRDTTFERLRHQAELQLHRRVTGEHRIDLLPLEEGRGLQLLPEPSEGDVWLDLEGHPWFEPARGLEFLFSRNRLNVAVSRAQCAAYLVASPRLLEASCRTVDQMRLVNALCRFVELAGVSSSSA